MKFTRISGCASRGQSSAAIWLGGNPKSAPVPKRTTSVRGLEYCPTGCRSARIRPSRRTGLEEIETERLLAEHSLQFRKLRPIVLYRRILEPARGGHSFRTSFRCRSIRSMAEARQRDVQPQKMLDDAGEQVRAAAYKVLLVEFQVHRVPRAKVMPFSDTIRANCGRLFRSVMLRSASRNYEELVKL